MAEEDKNDFGDEYHFSDLDNIGTTDEGIQAVRADRARSSIWRNAIIALVLIVLGVIGLRFLGPMLSHKTAKDAVPPLNTTMQPVSTAPEVSAESQFPPINQIQPYTPPPTQETEPAAQSTQPSAETAELSNRLSLLETNQRTMSAEIESLNSKITSINSNINQITTQLASLNQNFTVLLSRVEQELKEIAILKIKAKPKVIKRVVIRTPPPPVYFIQAIIPGRAWLIAKNGSTITVREGTAIAGYGVVKLIDSSQGRIVTSSGKVIRFSQQDS